MLSYFQVSLVVPQAWGTDLSVFWLSSLLYLVCALSFWSRIFTVSYEKVYRSHDKAINMYGIKIIIRNRPLSMLGSG